jgi:hypothetical protein
MVAGFDTLRAARRLKEAGASAAMAEAIAEVLRDSRDFDLSQLATKADIARLEQVMATKADVLEAKNDVLKWMIGLVVGLFVAQVAAVIALVRLLGHG